MLRRPRPPIPLKLYFIVDDSVLEADFVVARTEPQARRLFNEMYGSDIADDVELIARIEKVPDWLTGPEWLGPDPYGYLEDLGGRRLDSIGPPRWQFGDRVIGYPGTDAERYDLGLSKRPKGA